MQAATLHNYTDEQLWAMINSDPAMRPPPQQPLPTQPQPPQQWYPTAPAAAPAQDYHPQSAYPPTPDMQHNNGYQHAPPIPPGHHAGYAPNPAVAYSSPAHQYPGAGYQQPSTQQYPQHYPTMQPTYPPTAQDAGQLTPPPVPSRPSPTSAFQFNQVPLQQPPPPYVNGQQPRMGSTDSSMSRGSSSGSPMSPLTPTSPYGGVDSPHSEGSPNNERTPPGLNMLSNNPAVQEALRKKTVDLAFCVDCTGSMKQWLDFVKAKVVAIANKVKQDPRVIRVRLAFVGYRDYVYPADQRYVIHNFTDSPEQFAASIRDVPALYCNGNDEPEDLLGGLNACLTKLDWQSKTKIVILITDAPCHGGKEYHDLQENPNNAQYKDPLRPDTLLRAMSDRFTIDLTFCRIKADTDRMIQKFESFYNNPKLRKQLEVIQLTDKEDDFMAKIVKTVTASVVKANR